MAIKGPYEIGDAHPRRRPRIARICLKCEPPRRNFGDPDWVCPKHGEATVQKNRPYMGKPIPSGEDGTR